MIGRKLAVTTAVMAGALALPGASGAAPPTQDSAVLTGQGVAGPNVFPNLFVTDTLNATSGPSGEDPSGQASFTVASAPVSGPVTCLAVTGNRATLNVLPGPSQAIVTVQVVDDDPDTFAANLTGRVPSDCSPLSPAQAGLGGPLSAGDITVVDAQPLPTTKNQCKNGGWKQFGFKNQGRCIRFV